MKKLDSLYALYEKEESLGHSSISFDKRECFLYGFDIYTDGENFGLINYETGDKLKFKFITKSKSYRFDYESDGCSENGECIILLRNNYNELTLKDYYLKGNDLDSDKIRIEFLDTLGIKELFLSFGDIKDGMIGKFKENKAKKRFEGNVTRQYKRSSYDETQGYLNNIDIPSLFKYKEGYDGNGYLDARKGFSVVFMIGENLIRNGEECFYRVGDKTYKTICYIYNDGKCIDKMRIWEDEKLVEVAQVKFNRKYCEYHGWKKTIKNNEDYKFTCYINDREMEPSDCKDFKKW